MAAATPLLLVLAALHDDTTPKPGAGFEHMLVRAVHQFDQQAISRGVGSDCVNAARYIICTALDEAILAKAWAQSCGWSQHSLLSDFTTKPTVVIDSSSCWKTCCSDKHSTPTCCRCVTTASTSASTAGCSSTAMALITKDALCARSATCCKDKMPR